MKKIFYVLPVMAMMFMASSVLAAPADDFVITVKTSNPGGPITTFVIPTTGGGYDYEVDCNDANPGTNVSPQHQAGNYTCDYSGTGAGTYIIRIKDNSGAGTGFPRIHFNNGGDKDKLISIDQWGTIKWQTMESAFYGCSDLHMIATDTPDLSNVFVMRGMFTACTSLDGSMGDWDWNTSHITDISYIFSGATNFNGDVSNWDVGNVTSFDNTFRDTSFNHAIGSWDVSGSMNFVAMFFNTPFNQDISNWVIKNNADVTMSWMFYGADSFNQIIGYWDVSRVIDMSHMFDGATAFNKNLGIWDISQVTDMTEMFDGVTMTRANYDALLSGWSTKTVQSGVSFDGGGAKYCEVAARNILTSAPNNWTITDGGLVADCQAPTISEVTPIPTPTTDTTPNYTFDTDEAGSINYGGSCSSSATSATIGNNTITFNELSPGTYNNCTIIVIDSSGNRSNTLSISDFTIDIPPTISEITPIGSTLDTTPNYTFNTDEAGSINYGGSCASATTNAIVGNNTVTFNELSPGTYDNCTITVMDSTGNISNTLNISDFTIEQEIIKTPIYRLYNTRTGFHLYTRGEADRDKILNKWHDFEFTDGGPAFYASLTDDGATPIFRLYNTRTGTQLYTRGEADRDKILNKWHDFEFTDNGPAFYASLTSQPGMTPIFRLYNTRTGAQLYTRGEADRDKILNKWHDFEFTDGGPAFWASLT